MDTGLVFTREDGSMLRPDFVTHRFRDLAAKASVPVIRLHDLRHTSASGPGGERADEGRQRPARAQFDDDADRYSYVLPAVAAEAAEQIAGLVPRGRATGTDVTAM